MAPRNTAGPERSSRYIVQSVVHAAQILRAFTTRGEVLRLRDLIARTGYSKGLCFRLLHTLHHCGLVEKVDESRYRLTAEIHRRRRFRLGYAAQGQDTSFPRDVHAGLVRAAEREDLELMVVNNRYQENLLGLGRREAIEQGELCLYAVRARSRAHLFWAGIRGLFGKLDQQRDFITAYVEEAEISANRTALTLSLDGETRTLATPLRYRIRPKALTLIVPAQ